MAGLGSVPGIHEDREVYVAGHQVDRRIHPLIGQRFTPTQSGSHLPGCILRQTPSVWQQYPCVYGPGYFSRSGLINRDQIEVLGLVKAALAIEVLLHRQEANQFKEAVREANKAPEITEDMTEQQAAAAYAQRIKNLNFGPEE